MPSFDIVSEIESVEIRHSVENAQRELSTRFDFKNVDALIELDKNDEVRLVSPSEMQCNQLLDILRKNLGKHGVEAGSLKVGKPDPSGKTVTVKCSFLQGIEKDMAKKITKLIKDSKLKVQAQIQGEEVRVTGKKRDDLQQTMQVIKNAELGQPFQFKNFRD